MLVGGGLAGSYAQEQLRPDDAFPQPGDRVQVGVEVGEWVLVGLGSPTAPIDITATQLDVGGGAVAQVRVVACPGGAEPIGTLRGFEAVERRCPGPQVDQGGIVLPVPPDVAVGDVGVDHQLALLVIVQEAGTVFVDEVAVEHRSGWFTRREAIGFERVLVRAG